MDRCSLPALEPMVLRDWALNAFSESPRIYKRPWALSTQLKGNRETRRKLGDRKLGDRRNVPESGIYLRIRYVFPVFRNGKGWATRPQAGRGYQAHFNGCCFALILSVAVLASFKSRSTSAGV